MGNWESTRASFVLNFFFSQYLPRSAITANSFIWNSQVGFVVINPKTNVPLSRKAFSRIKNNPVKRIDVIYECGKKREYLRSALQFDMSYWLRVIYGCGKAGLKVKDRAGFQLRAARVVYLGWQFGISNSVALLSARESREGGWQRGSRGSRRIVALTEKSMW